MPVDPQWAYKKYLKRDLGQRPVKMTYKTKRTRKEIYKKDVQNKGHEHKRPIYIKRDPYISK